MLDDRKEIVTIDLREVISSKDLQIVLMEKLEFPDFYGKNWNAFWDSITGLVEMPQKIIFLGWDTFSVKLPKDAEMLRNLFEDFNKDFPMWKCEVEYR